jgi:excisionase family DNA binding protein
MRESLVASSPNSSATNSTAGPTSTRRTYLSAEQAAEYLNVSPAFIKRAASSRRLRHFRVGKFVRFDPADLDAFAEVQEATTEADPLLVTEVWSRSRRIGR